MSSLMDLGVYTSDCSVSLMVALGPSKDIESSTHNRCLGFMATVHLFTPFIITLFGQLHFGIPYRRLSVIFMVFKLHLISAESIVPHIRLSIVFRILHFIRFNILYIQLLIVFRLTKLSITFCVFCLSISMAASLDSLTQLLGAMESCMP